jgi:hypothetical protein
MGLARTPVVWLAAALALPPSERTGCKLAIRLWCPELVATPLQCPSRGERLRHWFIVQSAVGD